jgi:hypothetical protein
VKLTIFLKLLYAIASIRRAVPYGVLKNATCAIESAIERRLAEMDHRVKIENLIERDGRWLGGVGPKNWTIQWAGDVCHMMYPPHHGQTKWFSLKVR